MTRLIIRTQKNKHDRKTAEFYAADEKKEYHTEFGTIPKKALQEGGQFVLGKEEFTILPATFIDEYARLQRGAQVVQPKDLGMIMASTGLSKDEVVVDIGAGSGFSSILFARVAKKVHAYDTDKNAVELVKKNLKALAVKNVDVALGDAYNAATVKVKDANLFFLDVPEPWKALETAKHVLKQGAWLVAYTPCITQAMHLVEALDDSFLHLKTVEVMERKWRVDGPVVRPELKDFQHTAFLTFIRKV